MVIGVLTRTPCCPVIILDNRKILTCARSVGAVAFRNSSVITGSNIT